MIPISKYNLKFVLHCFNGTLANAFKAIEHNGYISFSGLLTFNKNTDELKKIAYELPNSHILIETDAPYLAPTPYRGKKNHPQYLIEILKYLSTLKNQSLEELASITYNNTLKLFNINAY